MPREEAEGNYNLTTHELAARLQKMDDKPIQFYILKEHVLTGCDIDTILDLDLCEITIEAPI